MAKAVTRMYQDIDKRLTSEGFEAIRTRGTHVMYRKGSTSVTVSKHCYQKSVLKKTLRFAGLSN